MRIRALRISDINGCLNIQKLDKENYWKDLDLKRSIKNKDVLFVIAEENGKVVGYINGFIVPTKRTEAMIHETRVDKRERKKGIGKSLVKEFCKKAFRKGVKDIYAEVKPKHLKFYEKSCKFKKSGKWIELKKTK